MTFHEIEPSIEPRPRTKNTSRKEIQDESIPDDYVAEGSTPQTAIDLDGFDTLSETRSKPKGSALSREASRTIPVAPSVKKRRTDTSPLVPYPDGEFQHVRGPQSSFLRTDAGFAHRSRPLRAEVASSFPWQRPLHDPSSSMIDPPCNTTAKSIALSEWKEDVLNDISMSKDLLSPAVVRLHNVVTRTDVTDSVAPSHSLWIDRWHPRCADEVLGNEESARYLRNWLARLSLQTVSSDAAATGRAREEQTSKMKARRTLKRPRVVRQVAKVPRKRLRKNSGRWNSDDSDSDDNSEFDSGVATPSEGHLRRLFRASNYRSANEDKASTEFSDADELDISQRSDQPYQFGDEVRNTILLSGPVGCGKTAAVHACAEELGWEVFELYPGMGERNGPLLNKLIGDVGKNHLVQQTSLRRASTAPQPSVLDQFLEMSSKGNIGKALRRVVSDDEDSNSDTAQQDVSVSQLLPTTEPSASNKSVPPMIRQSVVLIEEVDVLFKSDTNFWPTLISVIKDCKRPIIMTCNGRNFPSILHSPY